MWIFWVERWGTNALGTIDAADVGAEVCPEIGWVRLGIEKRRSSPVRMCEFAEAIVLLPEPFRVFFNAINEVRTLIACGMMSVPVLLPIDSFIRKSSMSPTAPAFTVASSFACKYHSAAFVSMAARASRMARASLSFSKFSRAPRLSSAILQINAARKSVCAR